MKASAVFSLFVLIVPLAAQDKAKPTAQAPAPAAQVPAPGAEPLLPSQQAFLNLPEESRKDFIKHFSEANRLFQQKRIFEALDELEKSAVVFNQSPEINNLRGSCYVEMRSFDKALVEFNKAASLTKANPSIDFNIGEVYFVTREWQKALDTFEKVIKVLPPDNVALGRLVEFKMLLCKLKLNRPNEVTVLSEKYDFLDDSPFYYYAKAALAYQDKNLVHAEEWLARASRIFRDPNIIAPWQDTLVEFGYIKSFYGENTAPGE
jgi:tetratricopeptide (TPR) repeat protein